jgi:hypothetical protein
LNTVSDRFGCVDGRAAAHRNNEVRSEVLEGFYACVDPRDRGMLLDVADHARIRTVRFENVDDSADHVRL